MTDNRDNYRRWLKDEFTFTWAVTFRVYSTDITQHALTAKIFYDVLNQKTFGKHPSKYHKLAAVIIREYDGTLGWHMHAAIGGFPWHSDPQGRKARGAIEFAHAKNKGIWRDNLVVKRISNQLQYAGEKGQKGWINYITKGITDSTDDALLINRKQPFGDINRFEEFFTPLPNGTGATRR
jgi:hypothetical protein